MKPSKTQRIAILKEIIKFIQAHSPSLESHTRDQIGKFIRRNQARNQKVTVDDFFFRVPPENRTPRSETTLDSYYSEMLLRFQDELEILREYIHDRPEEIEKSIGHPSVTKATPPPMPPKKTGPPGPADPTDHVSPDSPPKSSKRGKKKGSK